jgi:hypothetical protein
MEIASEFHRYMTVNVNSDIIYNRRKALETSEKSQLNGAIGNLTK